MPESSAPSPALAEPTSFDALLAGAQRPLFAFVAGLVGNLELARDITQDVFVDAWRATQRGSPPFGAPFDGAAARRWLFHAAYCDAANTLRHGSLISWNSLDAASDVEALVPSTRQSFEDAIAERQVLAGAMAALSPDDAACLLLNALQGFTAQEIGRIVGISAEASKKRLARAKQRFREAYTALNRQDEEPHA
jgi:RNA polymerase sigma-70 factor (ECF subfamily)